MLRSEHNATATKHERESMTVFVIVNRSTNKLATGYGYFVNESRAVAAAGRMDNPNDWKVVKKKKS